MRFLVDECTGPAVARWLLGQGYEVFSVYEEGRGMADEEVIRKANEEGWVLVTNDKDFGEKVYRERHPHKGVVLLRLEDERTGMKIRVLERLLERYGEEIEGRFVVVSERGVRFGK